jgi:hypothetical protein
MHQGSSIGGVDDDMEESLRRNTPQERLRIAAGNGCSGRK